MDKLPLVTPEAQHRKKTRWQRWIALGAILALAGWHHWPACPHRRAPPAAPACPQVDPLVPSKHADITSTLDALYDTEDFKVAAAELLGGAVRVKTEGYDDMLPVGSDARWEVFGPFNDYLATTFPQVHATLALTKVNTYALVYHWQGSDASLQPLLITGHQDVVPVEPETEDQWIHPPYSGHYDGDYIWGRGSVDDKSTVIASLEAIEQLIKQGFVPKRSVVLAFGIDEESRGEQGALQLAGYLEKKYGRKGFALLVDEGGGYVDNASSTVLAAVAVAEKGYLDAHITVRTSGGHSSVPPANTGIGILSALIVQLEANPQPARLTRSHVVYDSLQCIAAHVDGMFPPALVRDILDSATSDAALSRAEKALTQDPLTCALLSTTQAVDLVKGGVKVNALPELVNAVVNYRIDVESSVDQLKIHLAELLEPTARKFGLSFSAFPDDGAAAPENSIVLTDAWNTALEPAPRTPTGPDAKPYALLSGTIQAAVRRAQGDETSVVVAPLISTGNTDTRRYWGLTDHIFRYSHLGESHIYNGAHTVNEALRASGFVNYIRFFTYLILNADEAALA